MTLKFANAMIKLAIKWKSVNLPSTYKSIIRKLRSRCLFLLFFFYAFSSFNYLVNVHQKVPETVFCNFIYIDLSIRNRESIAANQYIGLNSQRKAVNIN